MPSRQPEKWYRTRKGLLTWSIGSRGYRVTLFETTKGGPLYRRIWAPGKKATDRVSLRTRDRETAVTIARRLYAALLTGTTTGSSAAPSPRSTGVATQVQLGPLVERFMANNERFKDNTVHGQRDTRGRLEMLRRYFGDDFDVSKLTEDDIDRYAARRREGKVERADGTLAKPVGQRSAQADVKVLQQVLYYATRSRHPDKEKVLVANPVAGYGIGGEPDPIREVATPERFAATRAAMQLFQHRYEERVAALRGRPKGQRRRGNREKRNCESWIRAELGLVLLEATGRRRGAVVGLRWEDINFESNDITWRGTYDKLKRTTTVPYPAELIMQLADFRRRLDERDGWLFPHRSDARRHAPPELLSQRILQAEGAAGLPKLRRTLCHAYRRKWRTERMWLPDKICMVAGGWTDHATMIHCYDQPSREQLLAATSLRTSLPEHARKQDSDKAA